jgi:hypothetical protein
MRRVRLLPNNVYYDAHEWNRGYMERLASDRFLYTFCANPGPPLIDAIRDVRAGHQCSCVVFEMPCRLRYTGRAYTTPARVNDRTQAVIVASQREIEI